MNFAYKQKIQLTVLLTTSSDVRLSVTHIQVECLDQIQFETIIWDLAFVMSLHEKTEEEKEW